MSILTATNVGMSFGADDIFSGISVEIPHDARIALVGPNGAGKTTFIRVLLGIEPPTVGTVSTKRGLSLGFLPQRPELKGNRTVWAEMMTAFTDLQEQEARLQELEHALADPARAAEHDELLARYGRLQEVYEHAGGYNYEYETRRVLHGLSFTEDDYHTPLTQLSGGQVTRALLARLLLETPDLLILDEPTNHLDIQAVEWLEGYLKSWQGAVLIVSHDRYFMDKTVNVIWEMNFGGIEVYRGNYSHYVEQRTERHERLLKEYEAQQEFIKKELDYIRRNIAGQNTAQAKGRRKRLERMMSSTDRRGRTSENNWLVDRPTDSQSMNISLNASRTGTNVFRTKGLKIGYTPDDPLFDSPEILLLRGEVAAIIGPNGVGKSTFLKSILGKLEPLAGEYEWGAKVKVGYFAQAHEDLNPNNSLLDELLKIKPNMETSQARNYLAQYLFTGEDVFRRVDTLSGGERGRLALAKLALMGANVLLLDEPTNHLDITSQEILEEVLADYTGTILLVSHDRYLIDALATQIWAIEPGAMGVYKGAYQEYLAAKEVEKAPPPVEEPTKSANSAPAKKSGGLSPAKLQKMLAELEKKIHQLETDLADVTAALDAASRQGDVGKVTELGHQYTELEAQLNAAMNEWAELA